MAERPIERLPMYGWYDPAHLLQIGIRVGIATIFGEFLDRRELFGNRDDSTPAALDEQHDYSEHPKGTVRNEIWLDYVADTGDGWDSTFAVARLLAKNELGFAKFGDEWLGANAGRDDSPNRIETHRGEILIFGGDAVYATASRDEYRNRLTGPFDEAAKAEKTEKALEAADVYAIPGNHDWYDGLNAFMGLFGARRPGVAPKDLVGGGRLIGKRRCKQTRSYFALKLPGKWWLLGVDSQLSGYIDRGQVSFFDDVAQKLMEPNSNIILCAAMPSWSYVDLDGDAEKMFRNYSYLESVVSGITRNDPNARHHNLRLVLTGDSHHYTRYMEWRTGTMGNGTSPSNDGMATEVLKDARCYLTWGGGGAFLHPTHQLEDVSFEWRHPPPPPVAPPVVSGTPERTYVRSFHKQFCYPDRFQSKLLSCRVPLFGWNNPWFAALMFAFGLVVSWALAGAAGLKGQHLPDSLRAATTTLCAAVTELFFLLTKFPWVILTCAGLVAALTYFSAAQRMWLRWLVGGIHFAAYFLGFFAVFLLVARYVPRGDSPMWSPILLVLIVAGMTAILAPLIMGIYLWISLTFFRRHWNEAFSSLRIKNYKGFLRLHIKDGVVTVYPIAMDEIPPGGEGVLSTRLIERPIRIA